MPGARSPELMDLTSPECRPELGGAAPVLPAPAPCLSSPCPPPKAGSRRQAWAFTNTTVLDPHSNFIRRSFLKPSPHFAGGKSDAQRSLITFLKSHSQEAVELPSPASGWRAGSRMPGQRPCAAQPWDGALQRRGSGRGAGPGDCLAPSPWPSTVPRLFLLAQRLQALGSWGRTSFLSSLTLSLACPAFACVFPKGSQQGVCISVSMEESSPTSGQD